MPAGTDAAISLPGTYVVSLGTDAAARQFLLDNATATLSGAGTLTVSDLLTWRNGTLGGPASGVIRANGGLLLTGSVAGTRRTLARTLINAGPGTWDDAATLALANGCMISNLAAGTFVLSGTGGLEAGGGSGLFANAGVLRKTGPGTTDFGAALQNSGTLRIESGALSLRQGIAHSGSLQISNLAGLTLAGGTHTFAAGSTLTGAGDLTVTGGNATFGGLIELSGHHLFRGGNVSVTGTFNAISNTLTVDGANVTFSGNFHCISNLLEVTSGSARFDGSGTLEPRALTVGPSARLEGSTPVIVRGPLTLQAATLAGGGTVVARDGLTLAGGALSLSGRTLVNAAAGRWGGVGAGTLTMSGSAAISNLVGASFELDLDATVANTGGAVGFVNEGLFRKAGGTGTTVFTTPFANHGTLETLTGTLSLAGGGSHRGAFLLDSGTRLSLGGTHNFAADSALSGPGVLAVTSGTANFAGLVDVGGDHVFSGGTANLAGRYVAISNLISVSGGIANFSGTGPVTPASLLITNLGVLGGSGLVTVRGPMRWSAGRIQGSGLVVAENGLELFGGALTMAGRTIVNRGAGRWIGGPAGSLSVAGSSTISNLAGASFELALDAIVADSGGAGGFVNEGLFRKTGGAGSSVFTTPFANHGTLETLTGTLSLAGGGSHRGSFVLGSGARLGLGGTHNFAADSALSGPGDLAVTSGTANFAGLVDVSGDHVFSGGTANLTGRYVAISNLVSVSGGIANFSGTGPVTPSSLVITNLGVLGGSGLVTVRGPMRWSAGRIQGSGLLVAENGLELFGGALTMAGRTIVNRGAGRWIGGPAGSLSVAGSSTISNLAGASFELALDAIVADSGGAGGFVNEGLFRKTGGAGSSVFTTPFANHGAVETLAGTLSLAGGGGHRGAFLLGSGTRLSLGGTHNFAADSALSGPGDLAVTSGTANFAGLVDVSGDHIFSGGTANLTGRYVAISNLISVSGGIANFSGTGPVTPASLVITNLGVLGGNGLVTVRGPMRWSGGRIQGAGLVVAENGLELFGGALTMAGRALVNRGAGRWIGGPAGSLSLASSAVISNLAGASFEIALDAIVADSGGAGGFVNDGLFRKTGSAGSSVFTTPFRNTGRMELLTGTLRLQGGFTQTAGNLLLRGGNLVSSTPIRLLGGRLSGSGSVLGSITNAGWIQPGDGPGRMILDGDYAQNPAGSCEVRLGGYVPGRDHDQLVISNTASLGGILVADLAEGFEPAPGAAFEILTSARRTGTFSTFNYPSNVVGLGLEYSISNVLIRVVNTRPVIEPIPDQVIDATGSLTVSVTARDVDLPVQTLRFALTNAPVGATIDDQGVLRWTGAPTAPGYTTNLTVVVTDNGTPNLGASRTFEVRAGAAPGLTAVSLQFGTPAAGANTLTFRGTPGNTYHAEYSLQVLGPWFDLATASADNGGLWTVVDPNATNAARFYRAR